MYNQILGITTVRKCAFTAQARGKENLIIQLFVEKQIFYVMYIAKISIIIFFKTN